MALTQADKERVEADVRRMIAEYRAKPTQEKEDGLGVELLAMPSEERDYVGAVLMAIVSAEAADSSRRRTPRR
ncbi:MAG: hypothetical protein R2725_13515 [Solirubrobacterales bacterium]